MPAMGKLYPDQYIKLLEAETLDQLKDQVKGHQVYREVLADVADPLAKEVMSATYKGMDEAIFRFECKRLSHVFDEQCNLASVYAYIRLKELEIKNLVLMGELIYQNVKSTDPNWNRFIVPFPNENFD